MGVVPIFCFPYLKLYAINFNVFLVDFDRQIWFMNCCAHQQSMSGTSLFLPEFTNIFVLIEKLFV